MIDENKNNQPLDLSYLKDMSGNSAEFMIEMLDVFAKQTPIYMDDLEKAIDDKNWKATSEFAHKIKPTFFYVGRVDVRDLMQEIERNARELINIETIPNEFKKVKVFISILYTQLAIARVELEKQINL